MVDDGLDSQTVEVEAPESGYLVLADAVQIGWQATVDGEPAELLPADHAMGAVRVPAGRHVVRFSFEPPGRRVGAALSLASTAGIVALLVAPWLGRARRRLASR